VANLGAEDPFALRVMANGGLMFRTPTGAALQGQGQSDVDAAT